MSKVTINHRTKEVRIFTDDNGLTAIIKFECIQISKETCCTGDYFAIRMGHLYNNKLFIGDNVIFIKNYEIL